MLIGVGFAAIKTIPAANSAAIAIMSALLGGSVQIVRDPTDLIALPMLLMGWQLWQRAATPNKLAIRRSWFVLALGACACMATSSAVPPALQDPGIICIDNYNGGILARSTLPSQQPFIQFFSTDGGLHWRELPDFVSLVSCHHKDAISDHNISFYVTDSNYPTVKYVIEHGTISRQMSTNGIWGSWEVEYTISNTQSDISSNNPVFDEALIDPATGNLIVAAGSEGVLTRTANDGQYHWIMVGLYSHIQADSTKISLYFIEKEWLFILAFALLNLTTGPNNLKSGLPHYTVVLLSVIGWLSWIVIALLPLITNSPIQNYSSAYYSVPIASCLITGLILAIGKFKTVAALSPLSRTYLIIFTQIPVVCLLIMYALWDFNFLGNVTEVYAISFLFSMSISLFTHLTQIRIPHPQPLSH